MSLPAAMGKGERTRAAILDEALKLVSRDGLDGVTIGTLAEATGLSKSGLFAHFGSREDLLLAVLGHVEQRFAEVVFRPSLDKPRGLPRLRAMFTRWLEWTDSAELPGGCPIIGAAAEFDDRPGPVRDRLAQGQKAWIDALHVAVRQAVEAGQLAPGTDPAQFVFELFGFALVKHHYRRLLGHARARARALAAFEALVERHAAR